MAYILISYLLVIDLKLLTFTTNIYIYILLLILLTLNLNLPATNIISSATGLFLKYKNQMVRNSNSNPAVAYYGETISPSRHLRKLLFPA